MLSDTEFSLLSFAHRLLTCKGASVCVTSPVNE